MSQQNDNFFFVIFAGKKKSAGVSGGMPDSLAVAATQQNFSRVV